MEIFFAAFLFPECKGAKLVFLSGCSFYSVLMNLIKNIFGGIFSLFFSLIYMDHQNDDQESLPDEETKSPASFDDLYEKYATDVLRVSYYYLGDRQRAEDVTQDVFVKLLVSRPSLIPGKEKAWLLKVALNRLLNCSRLKMRLAK